MTDLDLGSDQGDEEQPAILRTISQSIDDARLEADPSRQKLVYQVINAVSEAHMATCNYTSDKVMTGMKKYHEIQEAIGKGTIDNVS